MLLKLFLSVVFYFVNVTPQIVKLYSWPASYFYLTALLWYTLKLNIGIPYAQQFDS